MVPEKKAEEIERTINSDFDINKDLTKGALRGNIHVVSFNELLRDKLKLSAGKLAYASRVLQNPEELFRLLKPLFEEWRKLFIEV